MVALRGQGWQESQALVELLADVDHHWPHRVRISDGTIASSAHHAHNPNSDHEIRNGWVRALDLTDEVGQGDAGATFDGWVFAQHVADEVKAGRERRVKYLISGPADSPTDLIFDPAVSNTWRPQAGKAHAGHHVHISALPSADFDSRPWSVTAAPAPPPPLPIGDDVPMLLRNISANPAKFAVSDSLVSKRGVGAKQIDAYTQWFKAQWGKAPVVLDVAQDVWDSIPDAK